MPFTSFCYYFFFFVLLVLLSSWINICSTRLAVCMYIFLTYCIYVGVNCTYKFIPSSHLLYFPSFPFVFLPILCHPLINGELYGQECKSEKPTKWIFSPILCCSRALWLWNCLKLRRYWMGHFWGNYFRIFYGNKFKFIEFVSVELSCLLYLRMQSGNCPNKSQRLVHYEYISPNLWQY